MFKDLLGGLWRRVPRGLRRFTIRATQTRFTVTAAAIVVNSEGKVLLLKHRFRPGIGWGVPGGFIEAAEQPEDAVRRELREEVGLELDDIRIFTTRTFEKAKQVEIVFRCAPKGGAQPRSMEITRAGWFSLSSLPDGLPEDQRMLLKDALRDGAKPLD